MAGRDLARASRSGTSNPMRTRPVYPVVYGIATILIGIGSTFYHMSLAFAGQVLDVLSMYLLTSFMLLYNLSRMRRMRSGTFVVCYLLLNVAVGYGSIRLPVLRRYLFLALLLAVAVSKLVVRRKRRPRMTMAFLYAGLVSLVVACAIWILDVTRVVCAPGSWFQGHAMWHVLMAVLIGFIYLYYRSEDGCGLLDKPNICSYNIGGGDSGRFGKAQAVGTADLLRAGRGGRGVAPVTTPPDRRRPRRRHPQRRDARREAHRAAQDDAHVRLRAKLRLLCFPAGARFPPCHFFPR
jgi:hypothetical protein